MPPSIQTHKLKHEVDEHVFIMLECEGRPTMSLDISNPHGGRAFSIRVDGMTIFHGLLDVKALESVGERMQRFCPFCGEEIVLVSSTAHQCSEDNSPGPMLAEIIRLREELEATKKGP